MTGDGVGLYALGREQVSGALAECRRADRLARRVAVALDAAGLGAVVREVAGVVDETCRSVVCVTITIDSVRRLARLSRVLPGLLPDEVLHPPDDRGGPHGAAEAA